MSLNRGTVRTHALLLANDSTFDSTQANSLIEEIHQRYWKEFLKERVKVVAAFVKILDGGYIATTESDARDILNLMHDATPNVDSQAPVLRRDDFHAVVEDSEQVVVGQTELLRWGAQRIQGSSRFRVAVFPPASAATTLDLDAEILPEYAALAADGTALEGDDVDGYNVARLVACEVMVRNGDDPNDIAAVFAPLESVVREKFAYIMELARPNERTGKEQG